MTQKKLSQNSGNPIRSMCRNSWYEDVCRSIPPKTAPMNVLPTSPIKTFAGDQFQMRKPKIAPDIAQEETDAIMRTAQPATSPSRPSIKFVKLIMAVIKTISNNELQKGIDRCEMATSTLDVMSWTAYLTDDGNPLKSSINPTAASGRQMTGIHLEGPAEVTKLSSVPISTNDIPPPLGVGLMCELL